METRIAELRNARKWSQRELGEKVGATRDQIKNWEKGRMTIGQASKVADTFDVSLEYLLCVTDVNDRAVKHELEVAYEKLNENGRRKVMEYARDLAQTVTYSFISLPAQEDGEDDEKTAR